MRFEYTGLNNKGNIIDITIDAPEILNSKAYSVIDINLTLKHIALEALKYIKHPQSTLSIEIKRIDLERQQAAYYIKGEEGKPPHELSLIKQPADRKRIIAAIARKKIVSKTPISVPVEASLIERFTRSAYPKSLLDKLLTILSNFCSPVVNLFNWLTNLWSGISASTLRLNKDLTLLADICGTPTPRKMSMHQALKYMHTMLEKEHSEVADPGLNARMHQALKVSERIQALSHSFQPRKFKTLIKEVQDSIVNIGTKKILIPVGYQENRDMKEMLLEISRQQNGNYTVAVITGSQETRNLVDQELGVDIGNQSVRREITNVNPKELLAKIPTFIELQTSKRCLTESNTPSWRNIFLECLLFNGSKIEYKKPTEAFRPDRTFEHLSQTIMYMKGEHQTPEQGTRFELAARLHFFLELCKNKEHFKNKEFWTLTRTTALEFCNAIEEHKKTLIGKEWQGTEFTNIYTELKGVIDDLDRLLPELTDLSAQKAQPIACALTTPAPAETPLLFAFSPEPSIYPNIQPPFAPLNPLNPLQSIQDWGSRCTQLIEQGHAMTASHEAKLMVRMLPKPDDPFYQELKSEDAHKFLLAIVPLSEAIARGVYGKNQPSLQDMAAATALNCYAYSLARKTDLPMTDSSRVNLYMPVESLIKLAKTSREELLKSRLPLEDLKWLASLKPLIPDEIRKGSDQALDDLVRSPDETYKDIVDPNRKGVWGPALYSMTLQQLFPRFQPLFNISQCAALSLGALTIDSSLPLPGKELHFDIKSISRISLSERPDFSSSLTKSLRSPSYLIAPEYATDISQEITNRYLSEYCCLGCIRDNCPNYNKVDKKQHRIHPLYMLHNYVDIFCEKLVKGGSLYRDEVADLMYTQQTNQNAYHLWHDKLHQAHGYAFAKNFTAEDHQIQVMNTLLLFLEKPHFFKQPDLRWHFETRILNHSAFRKLLNPSDFTENKPFLISILKKLKKEIQISRSANDLDTAAYLVYIADMLQQRLKEGLGGRLEENHDLLALLDMDTHALLFKWSQEIIGRSEEGFAEQQKMVLSLLLNHYHATFCLNPNDPCFNQDSDIEIIVAASARLEGLEKGKEKIDPEVRDKYLTLLHGLAPRIQERMTPDKTPEVFVNKILFLINPSLASLQLKWDPVNFPTMMALDEEGKSYQFDLLTGKMNVGNMQVGKIPETLKANKDLQRIFGDTLKENWSFFTPLKDSSQTALLAYTHPKFPNHRIVSRKGSPGQPSQVVIEQIFKDPQGKKYWFSHLRFNEQERFLEGATPSSIGDIPPSLAAFLGNRVCWMDPQKTTIMVTESETNIPYASMKIKVPSPSKTNPNPQPYITEIRLADNNQYLLDPTEKMLENFTSIEDSHFILTTGNKNIPATVQYFRYEMAGTGLPLVYDINKKNIASKAFPGYQLQRYGLRPGSKDPTIGVQPLPATFDTFQLLKKDGNEKVLIPMLQFEQQFNSAGAPLPCSQPVFSKTYAKSLLFDYTLDIETNRLLATSGEAYAYLAYVHLGHRDYASAAYYLDKARSSSGYSDHFDTVFEWIGQIKDASPNATALKLRFELFRERVLEDRYMQTMKQGKLADSETLNFQKIPRLIAIADHYDHYRKAYEATIPAEEGIDPSLTLAPEEERHIQQLLNILLKEHGDQNVFADVGVDKRPIQSPALEYLQRVEQDKLGLNEGVTLLWQYSGNAANRSLQNVNDPFWILDNFRDIFNQLLELDSEDQSFKKLEHQIRISTQIPENLSEPQIKAIKYAQYYLFKLISLKQQPAHLLDPTFLDRFKEKLGANGKLPKIEKPFFKSSQNASLKSMNSLFKIKSYDKSLLYSIDGVEKLLQRTRRRFKKNAYKFINEWKKKGLPEKAFYKDFRQFLMSSIYGRSSTRSMLQLEEIFAMLDPIKIRQPSQKMMPSPKKALPPAETYRQKYGKLIKPETDLSTISTLEKAFAAAPLPSSLIKITTSPDQAANILGDNIVKKLTSYFDIQSQQDQPMSEKVFDDLAQSEEKAFVRLAEENRRDMQAYTKEHKPVSLTGAHAKQVHQLLVGERKKASEEKEKARKNLLQFVERFHTPAGILAMRRLTGKSAKLSLDSLITMWLNGAIDKPWASHFFNQAGIREISEQALKDLDQNLSRYLELSVKHQHLRNTIDQSSAYLKTCGEGTKAIGDSQLATSLMEAIETQRHFTLNPHDSPDFKDLLFLEYNQGIILRPTQVETLREMLSDPNSVRQLRMGGGKSKVLLPVLAKRKANGKNLVMLMLPEELYETNCKDLEVTNRQLFGQEMYRFDFARSSDKSVKSLQNLYVRMLTTINSKGFMMTTKRSMLSFRNAYLELLDKLGSLPANTPQDVRDELFSQIKIINKILKLFRENTDVLADEVDACLDVRKEVNFSTGENKIVDRVKADIGEELISLILNSKPEEPLHELIDALRNNTQAAMTPEKRKLMMGHLAGAFYNRHIDRLHEVTREDFIKYIQNEPDSQKTEKWVFDKKATDNPLFKEITTLKAFTERGFGNTFNRVGNVNYGRDPVSGTWTIPYKASNTPHVGSEFDDEIEQISYTIQDYLQNGVSYKQVYQTVARMRNRALDEMRQSHPDKLPPSILDTRGGKEFETFIREIDPDQKIGKHVSLATVYTPENIEALVAIINSSPKSCLAFCHKQVIRRIRQYPSQIHSLSADVTSLVRNFSGFTGTPWNLHTYDDKINACKSMGVDGTTWALMLGRDVPIETFAFDASHPIDSILNHLNVVGNYQAFIDTGAYLRGTSNQDFIDKSLALAKQQGKAVSAGIYFDEAGRIVKKQQADQAALPLEVAPATDLMANLTLYDQAHTIGADIKQGRTARAIVTIGENTFIRDLFQAVWRLRQIHQEQRVVLAVSDKIKERILEDQPGELTVEAILKFCLMNEARREAEDNFRAEKEKIHGYTKRFIFPEIIKLIDESDNDPTFLTSIQQFLSSNPLFTKTRPEEEAYDQYGRVKIKEAPLSILERYKQEEIQKFKQVHKALMQVKNTSISDEEGVQASAALTNRGKRPEDWLPSSVESSQYTSSEVEQETQAEVEQELELLAETEQETQVIAETIIPIVSSGEAGHGEVNPLNIESISTTVTTGKCPTIKWPWGHQTGDLVTKIEGYTDVIQLRPLHSNLEFFDEGIFCSAIFERNLPASPEKILAPQCAFYSNRKPVKNVVISKAEGIWTMIIPTIHEAHANCRNFIAKADPHIQSVEVTLSTSKPTILYKTGNDRSDSLPFTDKADEEQFYRLYIQAKLFNGEIEFGTEEEKNALKQWLISKGPEKFKHYFEQYILAAKPRRFADAYPKSSLFAVFQELCPAANGN